MRAADRPLAVGAALALGIAGAAACVIIPPDPPPPAQVPVPFPGGGDGAGTGVLYLFRVDRSAANLADEYEAMVDGFSGALRAAGLVVANEAVGILYDDAPELIWSRRDPGPAQFPLSEVIRFHAARAPDVAPEVCTTFALYRLGIELGNHMVIYPRELTHPGLGDGGDLRDGGELQDGGAAVDGGEGLDGGELVPLRPFETRPSAFVTVLVEPSGRPFGYYDPRCRVGAQRPAGYFDGFDPVEWLIFATPERLPRIQTRLVFVATPENEGGSQMRRRCAEMPTFPKSALDVIAPSQVQFFGPFREEMDPVSSGRAQVHRAFDFCEAAAGTWAVGEFSRSWVADLKRHVGLSP